jgi:hypothetical protein
MSLPIFLMNSPVLNGADISLSPSAIVDISTVSGYCVHAIWPSGSSPTGNLVISASNDGINFVSLDTTALGGTAGQRLYNVEGAHYRFVEVSVAYTSGSGTITAYVSGKGK